MGMKELNRGSFSDEDKYNEALDFFYEEGYCDTRQEAVDAAEKEAKEIKKLKP